jgi:hypothetical protein
MAFYKRVHEASSHGAIEPFIDHQAPGIPSSPGLAQAQGCARRQDAEGYRRYADTTAGVSHNHRAERVGTGSPRPHMPSCRPSFGAQTGHYGRKSADLLCRRARSPCLVLARPG